MSFDWNGETTNQTGTVYTTCTGNLVFSDDDVRAVYIDWDDGTDLEGTISNKKEFANYQWNQITKPTGTLDIEHTYTGTGTYKPIIQVLNSFGFVSDYYGMDTTNTDVSPYREAADFASFEAIDGTATGVMNVENKRVLSGIDNSIFDAEGPGDLYLTIAPLVSGSDLANIGDIDIEITATVAANITLSGATDYAWAGAGESIQVITGSRTSAQITGGTGVYQIPANGGAISQVLKVKWLNPKYSGSSRADDYSINASYNYVKIFLVTKARNGKFYPVTYLSAGCPIKSVEDSTRYINMDFSQSRAKASNVTNLQYRYDVGKSFFSPVFQWTTVSGTGWGSDEYKFFSNLTVLSGGAWGNTPAQSKQVSFAYNSVRSDGLNGKATIGAATTPSIAFTDDSDADWVLNDDQIYRTNQFLVDDYGRFTDQYHLVRNSMQPSSQATYPSTTEATSFVSSIVDNKPYVFRITPVTKTGAVDNMTKLDMTALTGVYTADYTSNAFRNTSSFPVSLSGMNSADFEDLAGNDREANEYLLLLFPKKTNKLFFNINNYAKNLVRSNLSGASFTDNWEISGISYVHLDNPSGTLQNAYWKSVPFEDTTKVSMEYKDDTNKKYVEQSNSLSQSGYLSFDMPLDWDRVALESLCGGQFDYTTQSDTVFDLKVTGTCAARSGSPDTTMGNYIEFTRTGGDTLPWNDAAEVGWGRYIAMTVSATGSPANTLKKMMWVGDLNGADGWGGSGAPTKLYLFYGDDTTNYTMTSLNGLAEVVLIIRRINIYDIMTGCNKVEIDPAGSELTPVDATYGGSGFPMTYFASGGASSAVMAALKSAWHITNLYPLKISLSGTTSHVDTYPGLWNIFDATESHVEIITESDDSAYNLNSFAITSDLQITRGGTYYRAITKKGKVFISRTGDSIQTINFASVALGDSSDTTAWSSGSSPSQPKSLYGHLHKMRKIQENNVRVYWDEVQKDGTYVRFWGIVTAMNETYTKGGPKTATRYSFTMTVDSIALIDANSVLMTDIFPLGGIQSATNYS